MGEEPWWRSLRSIRAPTDPQERPRWWRIRLLGSVAVFVVVELVIHLARHVH